MEDWRTEYKSMKVLSKYQTKLLDEGAKSLAQSWILQALWSDYRHIKGITPPPPPNLQSSYKDFCKRNKY